MTVAALPSLSLFPLPTAVPSAGAAGEFAW